MVTEYNNSIKAATIDDAWMYWYNELSSQAETGIVTQSRDGDVVGEVLNAVTVIEDPTRCLLRTKVRNLPIRYCIGELLWYLSGNPRLSAIQLYTSAWDRMSDNGKSVNSNYGNIIQHAVDWHMSDPLEFDQMKMCEELLRKDPNTRQAVIHIKEARNVLENPTKDLNCTVCLQFLLREDKLYMTTYMRSNDLWMGFPNDVFQFTCMQIYLAMRLNVGLGSYTHVAGSLHMYKRDYDKSIANKSEFDSKETRKEK